MAQRPKWPSPCLSLSPYTGQAPFHPLWCHGILSAGARAPILIPLSRFAWQAGPEKGIIICAGGKYYLPQAVVFLRSLRHELKSSLPVELFYYGAEEMDEASKQARASRHSGRPLLRAAPCCAVRARGCSRESWGSRARVRWDDAQEDSVVDLIGFVLGRGDDVGAGPGKRVCSSGSH